MSRVYAPQEPMRWRGEALEPAFPELRTLAGRWGEVVFLTSPRAGPWTASALEEIWEGLAEFDSERDFLLFVGNPGLIAATAVLASRRARPGANIRALQWNGKHENYFLVNLLLPWGVRPG